LSEGPVVWPAALAGVRTLIALDEVASTMRHTALNDIAAMSALLYRLRRGIENSPLAENPEMLHVLHALETRIAGASGKLAVRFLPPAGRSARAEITEAVRAVVAAMAPTATLEIPWAPSAGRWAAITSDELQVGLGCLLENAVESVAGAGRGAVTVRASESTSVLTLEVVDDAEPIDAERADKLFDPFFTTRSGHPGLGLKVARAIAHRWEGELVLTPREPAGLVARLELPRVP
jgi:C4-dicarboxylate-specific signal transduction histidine kinase